MNVRFDGSNIEDGYDDLIVKANITSFDKKTNLGDNTIRTSRHLTFNRNVFVNQLSEPEDFSLNKTQEGISTVLHQIEIKSLGPTPIYRASGFLLIPIELSDVGQVVKISGLPTIVLSGKNIPVRCQPNGTAQSTGMQKHNFPEYRITPIKCPCLRYVIMIL